MKRSIEKQESLKKLMIKADESTNLTALRNQNRRTGQRSKKRETGHQNTYETTRRKVLSTNK